MRNVGRQFRANSPGGFSLTELLLAISILAFLTAITVGTLKSMGAGNRRVSCSTNLTAIYQALRLYRLEEGAYPRFDPSAADPGPGLWALFTFYHDPDNPGAGRLPTSAPKTGYLNTPRALHCPEDRDHSTYTNPVSGREDHYYDNGPTDTYLSYQVQDGSEYTYQPDRGSAAGSRQLHPAGSDPSFHPAANTVVTWCKWHRDRSKPRDYDLVLFLDGQVDFLPRPDITTAGWQRLPVEGDVK